MMVVKQETRFARQKKTAEVFTPPKLVNDMLNKIPTIVWVVNSGYGDKYGKHGRIYREGTSVNC